MVFFYMFLTHLQEWAFLSVCFIILVTHACIGWHAFIWNEPARIGRKYVYFIEPDQVSREACCFCITGIWRRIYLGIWNSRGWILEIPYYKCQKADAYKCCQIFFCCKAVDVNRLSCRADKLNCFCCRHWTATDLLRQMQFVKMMAFQAFSSYSVVLQQGHVPNLSVTPWMWWRKDFRLSFNLDYLCLLYLFGLCSFSFVKVVCECIPLPTKVFHIITEKTTICKKFLYLKNSENYVKKLMMISS